MTISFSLWTGKRELAQMSTALWMVPENEVLAKVFPENEYWDIPNPREFDFLANQANEKNVIGAYFRRKEEFRQEGIYVTDRLKSRNSIRLATTEDNRRAALSFSKEFTRIYNLGIEYQKQGKKVKVSISS